MTFSRDRPSHKPLFEFTSLPPDILLATWGALDDVVMGGTSESKLQWTEAGALFTGNASTANSGGFASVRTRNFEEPLDLSGYQGIRLHLKGDGKHYKFLIRGDRGWDSIAYSYSFDTIADQWMDVDIPFARLIPVFRARTVPDANPLNVNQIQSLQLMLSKFEYDGMLNPTFSPGHFAPCVASIQAY